MHGPRPVSPTYPKENQNLSAVTSRTRGRRMEDRGQEEDRKNEKAAECKSDD